ncbi:MAG: phosphoribosylaminoimidazolesuccinocarboxamide synthase [Burkholderiales bacterium]
MTGQPEQPLFESNLESLPFLHRGKVRDIYAVSEDKLLIIQTDRLSAFDVILPTPIPGKGRVLTALSAFWFDKLADVVPNHLTGVEPASVVAPGEREQVAGRSFVVKRLTPLPIEAVVRGFIAGSGWKDYQRTGGICGIPLPKGLREASKLAEPIFTPASKAPAGTHDENIPFADVENRIGGMLAAQVRDTSLQLYSVAAAYAETKGILIADTKFEFGLDHAGTLHLIDEALTPDSSRFWPRNLYATDMSPPSFDKQFVRDWLESIQWDKRPPAPSLPLHIVDKTAAKYWEALRLLTQP